MESYRIRVDGMKLSGSLNRMVGMNGANGGVVVLSQDNPVLAAAGDVGALTDRELVDALDAAVSSEREALAVTLRCLSEIERRGVHREMGYRTIFDYCILRLKFSEGAAMRRIYSARAAAKLPVLYEHLRTGKLSLSSVSRLAPHLTAENSEELIVRAAGARLREVETLVAELVFKEARPVPPEAVAPPQAELALTETSVNAPDVPAPAAPTPEPASMTPAALLRVPFESKPLRRDSICVESPGVIRCVFRASPSFHEKLELASRLLGRRPNGRLATVMDLVLDRFLAKEDPFRRKSVKRSKAAPRARRAARWIRDVVWRRDGARCTYTTTDGVRCEARTKLEYDHVRPWARGGASDDPANIRLLCRAHNLHLARKAFGSRVPAARPT